MNYNYNNYNNPYAYGQPNYAKYGQQNQQMYGGYSQPQPQVQQPMSQQPMALANYLPLTFVSGIEGAKAFIVQPNQIFYLKDSDSNLLFEKRADELGKYTLNVFELKQVEIDQVGKKIDSTPIKTENFVDKNELDKYMTLDEFSKYEVKMDNALDRISRQLDKINNRGGNQRNEKSKNESE